MNQKAEFTAKATMLRLPQVLEMLPVSRSTFYAGIRSGQFPPQVKVGRLSMWPLTAIENCISELDTRSSRAVDTPEQAASVEVASRLTEEFLDAVRSVIRTVPSNCRSKASAGRSSSQGPFIPVVVSRRT